MVSDKIFIPQCYSEEQLKHLDELKKSTILLSAHSNIRMLIKDVNSRLIIGSDESARVLGLKNGLDLEGMQMSDVPFKAVADHASQFRQQEQLLLDGKNIDRQMDVLDIFEHGDGVRASITSKKLIYHKESSSIIGFINTAYRIKLRDFVDIIPRYSLKFGIIGSIESINHKTDIADNVRLTELEQEVCFLLLLNWGYKEIADFMNKHRPPKVARNADTILKKKNYICNKLKLPTNLLSTLIDYLVSINFHHKMPESFYSKIIGSRIL